MASYIDQIPKQLAARRKAFAAARDNPALLPSCWAIVRSIANNMYDHVRNSVIGGCTFPDRPIYLSEEDAAFINFGATAKLLALDSAWRSAEEAGAKPPDAGEAVELSAERRAEVGRALARVARLYGTDQAATRVYNLEPWLQDMYRDRLDVDFAEDLQRQIDALNQYMDGVPKALSATGLNGKLAKGVMDAFNLFKTITGSSHQLDREKMSFVDRRSYVNTIQKIELIMVKADESLGSRMAGKSVVRELFGLWKDANYEMMALTRQLRVLWAGTSLDDRIQELADLLGAVQKATNRCTEESREPSPQLPAVVPDRAPANPATRGDVGEAFSSTIMYELVVNDGRQLRVREIRKFGPLVVVVVPGSGQPRYCWEVRKLGTDDDEPRRVNKDTQVASKEREMDVDRRVRYPMNCLVVPSEADKGTLAEDMADAWLEFHQYAFGVQFKEFLEAAKGASPAAFATPQDKAAKDLPASFARQMLARLVGAFVGWARDGRVPEEKDVPGFEAFRALAVSRLNAAAYLAPLRYRPFLDLFSEAGPQRRGNMWKRVLGPRYGLDRQLVAVSVLMKDWNGLSEHLKFLPSEQRKDSSLANGFAKSRDVSDPFSEHKAIGFFRKFLTDHADLKSALVTIESQVAIEVETLRTQSESLGRVFQYDQASEAMLRRQMSQIQEKRLAANEHIDHYLTGLMYAEDGNLEAAETTLALCLRPSAERGGAGPADDGAVPDEIGEEWFLERLKPRDGKFSKRPVPGEDSAGTACFDLVYYNLGIVYKKMGRFIEAAMCFKEVKDSSPDGRWHLVRQWAEEHAAAVRGQISETVMEA